MIDMDVNLCKRVSKFKTSDFKGVPQTNQILSGLFLTNHSIDGSDFLYDECWYTVLQETLKFEFPDLRADPEACPGPTNS